MKFVLPVLFLAAVGACMDMRAVFHLITKGKCILPCVTTAAESIPCTGKGPVSTVCANLDTIKERASICVTKCGIKPKHQDTVIKTTARFCKKQIKA